MIHLLMKNESTLIINYIHKEQIHDEKWEFTYNVHASARALGTIPITQRKRKN